MTKKNILFLCTGNSCRSQMADGLGQKHLGHQYNVYSAGTTKHGINPRAVQVMNEIGIDISQNQSNTIEELGVEHFDYIFTVCSDAHEKCPYYPNGKTIHVGFEDPPRLTKGMENEEEVIEVYRRVRKEIELFITDLNQHIEKST